MNSRRLLMGMLIGLLPLSVGAGGMDTGKIDQALGRSGEMVGEVYRVGFPRSDLHVQVQGIDIKPGLALGSWAAFSGSDKAAMVMGDLVLLPDELPKVTRKLRVAKFEISAIHNHLLGETPRVIYVHYMGHGAAAEIAASLRSTLEATATPLPARPAGGESADKAMGAADKAIGAANKSMGAAKTAVPDWAGKLEEAMGRKGTFKGGVLSFSVQRREPISMGGVSLTPAQGVAEAINFQEAGAGKIATTGDFVLQAAEVNPVLSALLEHGIEVTALHSHMLEEEPRLFFMHFWAVGSPASVAGGIRAALGHVSTR